MKTVETNSRTEHSGTTTSIPRWDIKATPSGIIPPKLKGSYTTFGNKNVIIEFSSSYKFYDSSLITRQIIANTKLSDAAGKVLKYTGSFPSVIHSAYLQPG